VTISSERPRDRLGRPLDFDDPRAFPGVHERGEISAVDAWNEAMDYLKQGLPFHAHEVFEQRWKSCPESERDAWQALAQWGAALTQQARGNETGQRRIASRARERLIGAQMRDAVPGVIDVDQVLESLAQLT
jgi:uncharacterized protein